MLFHLERAFGSLRSCRECVPCNWLSKKSAKIAALIEGCRGKDYDPHYLGYFECFNQQLFYEAHDVLEELWLARRHTPDDGFYKGLIQFAGAFVHLQKNRLKPAAALFLLSRSYLAKFGPVHQGLDLGRILGHIEQWLQHLETGAYQANPITIFSPPILIINNLRD